MSIQLYHIKFSNHYRVIAIDTRGHGNSPRGDVPFIIRQFADRNLGDCRYERYLNIYNFHLI